MNRGGSMRRSTRKRGGGIFDILKSSASNTSSNTTTKPPALCQCTGSDGKQCHQQSIGDTVFCKEHQHCAGSPMSGSEPRFNPQRYNKDPNVYRSHNCYSYSMNVVDGNLIVKCRETGDCRRYFHQPGAKNGDRNALNAASRRTCAVVEKLQKSDIPDIEKTDFTSRCPAGKSKIALVVDPGEDYHYYRQDDDGWWSHKDGSNKVKRHDAVGKGIWNPEHIVRDYRWKGSDLNYESFCGFYCVPRDHEIHLGKGGGGVGGAGKSWTDRLHRELARVQVPKASRTRKVKGTRRR